MNERSIIRTGRLESAGSRSRGLRRLAPAEISNLKSEMLVFRNTSEALKHAIPLGGQTEKDILSFSIGVPRPRSDLSILPQMKRASSTIGVGPDLMSHLRRLYRATFDRLAAQGRIEEAAFVLSELLLANEEAVAFLEK